ncbi:uncharacterized protein N7483_001239 [Penicillium malachiteum]|uniref:uncharacterized protein n=1 Tax=Penicillium malachiteum TaxID=1324776 RepID=UPI002546A47B|nr:uncharacterized protein N7483_001239 [Penicillium malachiteum]KAJ5736114.1 hypothetical protein N7483_001239 [Penicillium malachiteum]
MTANTAGFVYTTPLATDEHYIRLLKFDSTVSEEPLRFSLKVCKFLEKPTYNSLSYEWGDTVADRLIFINDRLFFIRENLHSFLKVLASSAYRDDYVFVDAICINQDDIAERNAQVRRVGDLYAQAENVLVWLGSGTAESDFVFDICSDSVASSTIVRTKLGEEKTRIEALDFNAPDGEALDTVYQRSYWTRLWIIQELFLAQNIILFCGLKSTPWSVFRQLPRWNKGVFVPGGFTGVDMVLGSTPAGRHARDILNELDKMEQGRSAFIDKGLVTLVLKFGLAQCFDVRDRVYGLLGLASASDKHKEDRGLEVVVDYSASPMSLFVRLLSTLPHELRIRTALDLFNILKLHHAQESAILASIPDTNLSLSFKIEFTHVGHLRHVTQPSPSSCRACRSRARNSSPFALNETQRQQLAGKTFSLIITGAQQNVMARHGGGPLYEMMSSDSCLTASGACEGDDVFLLEGTNAVLIRQQDDSGSTMLYRRGILCSTKSEQSIPKAAELLDSCLLYLPSIEGCCLRTDKHQIWSLVGPVEFVYEELSLQQIILLLIYAGQHRDHWNRQLRNTSSD